MKSKRHVKTGDGGRRRELAGDEPTIDPVRALSRLIRSSRRKQPIRLPNPNAPGQGPQSVLSLDAPLDGEHGNALLEVIAAPETELVPDWRESLKDAKLSKLERKVIKEVERGTPDYLLHKNLGVTPKAAKRATQSAIAKVSKVAAGQMSFRPIPDSLRLVFREYLPAAPGHRPAMFSSIVYDPAFLEIMAYEKYSALISERDPGSFTKNRFSRVPVRRRLIVFTTEVSEQEIAVEKLRLYYLRDSRSPEFIDDLARGLVQRDHRDETEAAERERIHGLNGKLDEEEKSWCDRRGVLLEALPNAVKKRDRLGKQLSQPQSKAEAKRIKDQKDEAEEEIDRIERELGEISWRLPVIREEQAYRVRQTLLPAVFARLNNKDVRARRRSVIEDLKADCALIASNPASAGDLAGLYDVLDKASLSLAWIDRLDATGHLRGI